MPRATPPPPPPPSYCLIQTTTIKCHWKIKALILHKVQVVRAHQAVAALLVLDSRVAIAAVEHLRLSLLVQAPRVGTAQLARRVLTVEGLQVPFHITTVNQHYCSNSTNRHSITTYNNHSNNISASLVSRTKAVYETAIIVRPLA